MKSILKKRVMYSQEKVLVLLTSLTFLISVSLIDVNIAQICIILQSQGSQHLK